MAVVDQEPVSSAKQGFISNKDWLNNGFGNDYWNPIDFIIPGFSWTSKTLDLDGSRAASAQAATQFSLDNAAREFSAAEAEKQRKWEEMMSNTAIQRQVADFKAAGLNPWLAVQKGGVGASTPTGSSATSTSGQANKADNKLAMAAGLIATALRIFLMKH